MPIRTLLALAGLLAVTPVASVTAAAGDVLPPVSERFAAATEETPDFQKHVVPLLGRLGCNGRACHGSFKGQGGFRLSLFGYDFETDHEQITNEEYSRVYAEEPDYSMLLSKPTLEEEHGGGKRMDRGSWQYNVLRRWIEQGTPGRVDESLKLARLEVTPSEIVAGSEGERIPLRAVAHWSDGSAEDVTTLCRFQSNNPAVAEIDETGLVVTGRPGDTHVVVFYDGGVVPIPVIRPVSDRYGPAYPQVAARTKVDELVVAKLSKLGVVPSDLCTDEEFLRRVSLDLTGTLPPAWEVQAFLADSSPDKRARKVDELLETPAYAAWWATKFCDWTGNNPTGLNTEIGRDRSAKDWYDWIEKRIAENRPYDEIVEGIVLAESREEGESYREFCEEMRDIYSKDATASFADRGTMPHYWARTNFRKAEDRAIGFAYTFLGIRVQCAQCHKHPFDQWTQDDFKNFEAFFTRVNYGPPTGESKKEFDEMLASLENTEGKKGNQLRNELAKMLAAGTVVPFREVYVVPPRPARNQKPKKDGKNDNRNVPAAAGRVLGGETVDLNDHADPREPLMNWLRSPENPYFARAFVNRVWSSYFNVGIVEPADDLSLANPPSNRPLLDHLAAGFVASGYDIKALHREVLNSDTYQRSWRPNETNRADETNFSHAVHRRLPAEAAYDAIMLATASDSRIRTLLADPSQRAIGVPGSGARYQAKVGKTNAQFALTVFGRNIRESNCECDRANDASLLQTVYLQNDTDVLKSLSDSAGTWIGDLDRFVDGRKDADRNADDQADAAQRVRAIRNEIKEIADEAAELRKAGENKEAKKLVARVAELRKRLADAERSGRKREEGRKRDDDRKPVEAQKYAPPNLDYVNDPARLAEQAYLRTLSRYPTPDEIKDAVAYMSGAESPVDGARDLLWALINTKEFIVNH